MLMSESLNELSRKLWAQFEQAIGARLGFGQSEAPFQMLPTAIRLPEVHRGKKQLELALELFFDTIPGWGAFYAASERTVSTTYQQILEQIDPAADSSQSLLQELDRNLAQIRVVSEQTDRYRRQKLVAFKDQVKTLSQAGVPPSAIPTWDQFWAVFKGPYEVMQKQAGKHTDHALDILGARHADSQYAEALRNLQSWLQASVSRPVAPWLFAQDPWKILRGWTHGENLTPQTIELTEKSLLLDASQTAWTEAAGPPVLLGGQFQEESIEGLGASYRSHASEYCLRIDFSSQDLLAARPDAYWFNSTILVNYKNGPWSAGTSFATGDSVPWGEQGIFPLMCTAAYIVYDPRLTLTLDVKSYRLVKSDREAPDSRGFRLGPFSGAPPEWTIEFDDKPRTVHFRETSAVPQIIAVTLQVMPDGRLPDESSVAGK